LNSIKIAIKGTNFINLQCNFSINRGDFVALSGKSGSGKSTLLRIIAGLEEAEGEIEVFGKKYLNNNIFLPPQRREIGLVFQDFALFENMSVEQNLLYVNSDKKLANRLLELTELQEYKKRYPQNLSGGQKQRVALARALMKHPKLLLLDEPLSALDWQIRQKLQQEIANIHKEFNLTTIMVSHDRAEIYKLSNRVIELENGQVKQDTKIDKTYKAPTKLNTKAEVVKVFDDKALILFNGELIEIARENLDIGDFIELKIER